MAHRLRNPERVWASVGSFSLSMLSSVCIVTWQSECILLTTSVARWLWPKSAKWCHKKLLDSAKSLVANFKLKSAKSSEVTLKNLLFLAWLKETEKIAQCINFLSCTCSQWTWAESAGLGQHTFQPTFFFQSAFWAMQLQLTLCFVWHTFLDDLFQMVACFYTVGDEQGLATNNLDIASALQLEATSNSRRALLLQPFALSGAGMHTVRFRWALLLGAA